jgi:hypothetical protein
LVEVCPRRIFAFGGSISARRPLSFFPGGFGNWLPINAYGLRDQDDFLLVDTGITPHWNAVRSGIAGLIEGCTKREAVVTRREPDAMMNLPSVVGDFATARVFAGGALSPLDFFDGLDEANGIEQIRATSGVTPVMLKPGSIIPVGSLRVEVLPSPLRVLFTNWLYESETRTLFSSDSWSFLTSRSMQGPFVAHPTAEEIGEDRILAYLDVKFDWLRGIDTAPVLAELHEVLDGRAVERICPGYGGIIEGQDLVSTVFANTDRALKRLATLARRSALAGFSWPQ